MCVRAFVGATKIRDAFENEGDAAEKSGDVCRDIATLRKSFRTYTGDG
jgi:hypothetical protein